MAGENQTCIYRQIVHDPSSTTRLLHTDEKFVEFQDIKPAARRFGFHQPPFNSVDHLHLHCFALPFMPRWKFVKYKSLGPFGGFIEAETLLEKIRPLPSKV
ncbi:bifunctional adenosine 5'-phosphosulfate phosphorylase/adenylylsulfatase HINT4-like isoform X2 [Raphanus sativus]|uniref:Bifunctional adenosine 5'-phosphosulfate phosphorylase/adenylylsulfatase HINT4-like isoform X2 n=1 Tax=Raphanus sativus TaxID=3726 RepID=A0A9W3CIN4_RAPSA|nr:bifunctional adenosine 5'-phosphosulfate phosphorylase/adenylylsulfatase HINT4-like isoform X2 [Raphanus sativus]